MCKIIYLFLVIWICLPIIFVFCFNFCDIIIIVWTTIWLYLLGHLLHLYRQLYHLLRFITFWLKSYSDYYTWKCKNKCCQCCYGNRLTHFISDCYHYPLFWLFLVLLFRDLYILFYFISLSVGLSLPFINLLIFYGNLVSNMQINR